jgi:SAM-dependent methyltransferase
VKVPWTGKRVALLRVPDELQRNAPPVAAAGYDDTAEALIRLAAERMGVTDFARLDVLDVGCGVRFAAAIVNRAIPIGSYTGVEVYRPIVDFLNANLVRDPRFRMFKHWNARNAAYNPHGEDLPSLPLPVKGHFDAIWMFSVVTHLEPGDTLALLTKVRERIRPSGKLLFSAFIDDELDGFEDRDPQPLHRAYYGRGYMESLIAKAGWRIDGAYPHDPTRFIMEHFVCSPLSAPSRLHQLVKGLPIRLTVLQVTGARARL